MGSKQFGEFAERVLRRLVESAKQGIDIAFIMMIMDMVMEMLENCPEPTRARRMQAYRRGVARGGIRGRFWVWRATDQIKAAGECSTEIAAAIVDEFGQLSEAEVADLV